MTVDEDDRGVVDLGEEDLNEADSGQSGHEFEVVMGALRYIWVSLDYVKGTAHEYLLIIVFELLSIESLAFDHSDIGQVGIIIGLNHAALQVDLLDPVVVIVIIGNANLLVLRQQSQTALVLKLSIVGNKLELDRNQQIGFENLFDILDLFNEIVTPIIIDC